MLSYAMVEELSRPVDGLRRRAGRSLAQRSLSAKAEATGPRDADAQGGDWWGAANDHYVVIGRRVR
jgi:hypothetical protein